MRRSIRVDIWLDEILLLLLFLQVLLIFIFEVVDLFFSHLFGVWLLDRVNLPLRLFGLVEDFSPVDLSCLIDINFFCIQRLVLKNLIDLLFDQLVILFDLFVDSL